MPQPVEDTVVHAGARVYARALLDLADHQGALDEVVLELRPLLELIDADVSGFRRVLDSQLLGMREREQILERVFRGRVHDLIYRFVQVVNRKGRLADLREMFVAALTIHRERRGIEQVTVTLAFEPDDAMRSDLERKLSESLGCGVSLAVEVDPSLLGGMVTRIGDRQIDASVASRLRRMNYQMMDAGRARAREAVAEAG
ncbi:ATP synthase F1 subunit delta [Mucisphaera calidilacus]|uniref:ATP synthase subunit delta n=1 Tax=Mucisphaera calidilacus TaxID=2527982 RepID=A0A518BZ53_9BACT|nr:ATP synthase F1 subunit delta [Mucisphaera calidilacus]QDU72246.1 ATP synthase subunit delta [Mucisphaera calidilacus]